MARRSKVKGAQPVTGDRNLYICAHMWFMIEKSIVCANKVLTDFVVLERVFSRVDINTVTASYIIHLSSTN